MAGKAPLGVSFLPRTPRPGPSQPLFLFTSSQGTRSLRTLIFPVSQYLPNWPLLFSRAFPSPPAPSPSPPGVSMATAEGRKQLTASCNCAPAVALRERKREAGKQELAQQNPPAPRLAFSSASVRAEERGHRQRPTPPGWWAASGAAAWCCCLGYWLRPSHRLGALQEEEEEEEEGGSSGWLVPKAPPNFLQLCRGLHGEVEPWPWAAPRQSSARAASTLGAGSLYTQRDRFAVIPEAAAPQSPGEGLGGAGCSPSPV